MIEKLSYGGWPNCYRLTDGEVELVVTTDVGPRVIRYGFVGGQNLFWENPDQLGKSDEAYWQMRGGHRLWAAPEIVLDHLCARQWAGGGAHCRGFADRGPASAARKRDDSLAP